jgi:hypothetical protein
MKVDGITPIRNVSSVPASFEWFGKQGWERTFGRNAAGLVGDGPNTPDGKQHGPADFGGISSGAGKIFLSCNAQGSRGILLPQFPGDDRTDGAWMTWWMESTDVVDAMHQLALQYGMKVTMPPKDKPWGVRVFHLRNPDGHKFRISCEIDSASDDGEGLDKKHPSE